MTEEKKIALVTGAGRGIGRAVAIRLAAAGCHIIINYASNDEAAAGTLSDILKSGGSAELLKFDVGSQDAVQAALASWKESNPGRHISIIINNAGIRRDNLLLWMPEEDWHTVLRTNLDSFYHVTQPLLKDMLAGKWGRIVNIASLSGIKGLPGQVNYSAAKGGLIAATKALAQEVAKKNVTVNAVAPGFIRTDMTCDLDEAVLKKTIPAGRFGTPEEVAATVAFLVSDGAAYITGETISINGGIYS